MMDTTTLLQGSTRLSLCLLLGITLVLALPGWKAHKEYQYQINGRTVAGVVSHQNQHAGIHYRGTLKVQTHSSNVLVMKLKSVTYWQIHEELPEGWWAESSRSSQEKFSELPLTNSSFIAKLRKDGEVENIYLAPELPDWEKNFIKGIISQLQFKTKAAFKEQPNAIHGSEFSESSSWERIMENTAFGRCETLYQVSLVPHTIGASFPESYPPFDFCTSKKYYEIFKTTNFSNCEGQAETHFGLSEANKCDSAGNFCGGFWNRVSGTRMVGCAEKKEFIVLQTETNSRNIANLQLKNASMASISSYIALNLTSIKRLEERLSIPPLRVTLSPRGYQYTVYDFSSINEFLDMKSEEVTSVTGPPDASSVTECADESADVSTANNGNRGSKCTRMPKQVYNATKIPASSTPFWHVPPFDFQHPPQQPLSSIFLNQKECPEVNNQIQKFKEIITDVARDLEDSPNIPNSLPLEKMMFVVQICRTMSLSSLKKAIGKIMDKPIRANKLLLTERKLYRDVVMMCGTGPSISVIGEWIEQYKITGEDAANVIASLPSHMRDPRPEVVQWFYNLTQLEAVRKDRQLSITANLALSNFIRIACVHKRARESRFPRTVLSPTCTQKHVEPYLSWFSNQLNSDPSMKRVYMIALGNTGTLFGIKELKSAAMNTNHSVYLRATAVIAMKYHFLHAGDTKMILFSLFQDVTQPIPVRISAVSMLFYARPSYDVWQRIALSTWYEPSTSVAGFVRSSLVTMSKFEDPVYESMSKNARRVVLYSKPISSTLRLSYNWLWATIFQEVEEIWAYQHIITNEIDAGSIYLRVTKRISQLTRLPFDGEIWFSNKDQLLTMIKDWLYPRGDISEVRPPIENLERPTRKVREILKIKQRTMPDLEGEVHGTIDKLTERIFVFDKKYIKQLLNSLGKPCLLCQQIQFNYHKMGHSELEFCAVTELGFPLCFVRYEPWLIRFNAKTKASQSSSTIEPTLSLMLTEQQIGKLSFYTPWDQTVYSVESHGVSYAHVPEINLKAHFDAEGHKLKFEVQTKVPENGHLLLHHSSQTLTSHRNVGDSASRTMSRTWKPIQLEPLSEMSKSLKLGRNFEAHLNYSPQIPYSVPLVCSQKPCSLYELWEMWPLLKPKNLQIKLFNVPNVQFDIGIGSAKTQNGKVTIVDDADKRVNETKSMSAIEDDLVSQIETGTNVSRKIRTIPSAAVRPTEKPTVTHVPATSTTLSPAKELLSNAIRQTAHGVVEEVMNLVKASQNTETSPSQFVSNVFDASSIKSTEAGDYSTYLLRESLSGISNGESKLIYMNITLSDAHKSGSHESKYSFHITQAENDNRRYQNLGIFLKEETEPKKWEIGWTSTLLLPEASYLNLKDLHQSSFETVLFSSLQYRLQNTYHNAALKIDMSRSDQRRQVLNKRLIQQQCSDMINAECRKLAYEAMLLDTYNVTLLYSVEEPYLVPWIEKALDFSSFYLLPYSSKAEWKSGLRNASRNGIKVALNIAEDFRFYNLQADTKSKIMAFETVPVEPELMKMLLYNPSRSVSRFFASTSVCGMSLNRISTFDETDYNYNMTTNWHVLTKDATGKTRFMILARASADATIELEVNMDNHVVASITSSGATIQQGQANIEFDTHLEYRDLNGTLLLRLNQSSVPEFTVTLQCPEHGMDILYTSTTVLIEAHEATRGRLVGLCGDNNGEKIADLQTPSKTIMKTPQEFVASYSLVQDESLTTSEAPPSSTPTSSQSTSNVPI